MHRLFAIAICSGAASIITLILAGVGLFDFIWIVPFAVSLTMCVWCVGMLVAFNTYRPRADAAAMMEGVCPECRTFNSLQEVTSADPNFRYVDCLACKERLRVQAKDGHLTAERLGKRED